jgi:hypothetical protein
MTPLQREALQMCLEYIETDAHERRHVRWKIQEALAEPATEEFSAVQPAAQPQQKPVAAVAWQQGYDQGVADERISEENIGIAGFGAKVNPARNNPYTSKQPAQQPAATESVLIGGAAYTVPAPVAVELLRLHLEIKDAPVQHEQMAAAKKDAVFEAAIELVGTLTGLKPPPIETAPPEIFKPFRDFTEKVCSIFAVPQPAQQQEPVARIEITHYAGKLESWRFVEKPLNAPLGIYDVYITPPAQRQPLTPDLEADTGYSRDERAAFTAGWEAAEAAHGIKGDA